MEFPYLYSISLVGDRWFIEEQTSEEAKMIYWRDRIVMYKSSGKPLGDIDHEMKHSKSA